MLLSRLGYQMSQLVVTITIVAFRLKSYDLVSKLTPKGLEIGPVVHVLCMRTVGQTSQTQKNTIYLDMSELIDCSFVTPEHDNVVRTSWHNVPISQDVETNDPSRLRSTSSGYTRRLRYLEKVLEKGNAFTDGLPVVPVSTSKDVVIFVLTQPTHESHLETPLKEPIPTHLLQTVDDKPVSFHDGSNLGRQRAQQLTRSLLFARIGHGKCGNEINMGVRVCFGFVEPQMDHAWVRSRTRRVKIRV